MITAAYAWTMACYNAEMNARLYAAAGRLPDMARRLDRGAFWGSIQGTLSHLLWADRMWMSRFDGWEMPRERLERSHMAYGDFAAMAETRGDVDSKMSAWAGDLTDDWFQHDLTWFSGAAQREITASRTLLVMHLFNHQTHHRGQVHVLLTGAGESPGATDLPLVVGARSA